MINNKLKILSELTEHTLANEIEAPEEILRKFLWKEYIDLYKYICWYINKVLFHIDVNGGSPFTGSSSPDYIDALFY